MYFFKKFAREPEVLASLKIEVQVIGTRFGASINVTNAVFVFTEAFVPSANVICDI
jgi:hypothetical protein